jgi:hypothetical protein
MSTNNTEYVIYEDYAVTLSVRRNGSSPFYIRLSPKAGFTGDWSTSGWDEFWLYNDYFIVNCGTVGTYYDMSFDLAYTNLAVDYTITKYEDLNSPTYKVRVHFHGRVGNNNGRQVTAIVEAYYP